MMNSSFACAAEKKRKKTRERLSTTPLRLVLGLALALEIERHCSADEILQGRLIDLLAFVDVDGAPDIPLEARVE
jgi:hypothetical protein